MRRCEMVKIKDIPLLAKNKDFTLVFCTFLDDFKQSKNKSELIFEKPLKGTLQNKEYCMLACAAHKLANDNGVEPPEWVYDKTFRLANPAYAFDTNDSEYQTFLKETSPDEYRQRNLFYGRNVLQRV